MSTLTNSISTGDIIGAYVPKFDRPGQPGHIFRNTLVVGLEVSPEDRHIVGVYVTRLSERTHLVKSWDYLLRQNLIDRNGQTGERDFVLRTPRVDLLPFTEDFFGSEVFFYGKVKLESFPKILEKMIEGQNSPFNTESLGPYPKQAETFVCSDVGSENAKDYFSTEDLLTPEKQQHQKKYSAHELSFAQQFERAVEELRRQTRENGMLLHKAFLNQAPTHHQNTPIAP